MANFNKVILAGNLTRDPELTYTASNMAICKLGLAVNRKWRDRNSGENREEACFVDCTAFGKTGETINQYMGKGRSILIEGHLRYSQWESQDGGKRSKLEVIVDNFQFLGTGQGGPGGARSSGARQPQPAAARGRNDAPEASGGGYDDYDPGPQPGGDDVPF